MSRIQQKIKDLIEVRSYKSLQDFSVEPAETLSSYHFTDITSELMANWIDVLSGVQNNDGAAKALAGYRGVGKSHFLATLGAIVANPELRSRVSDQYVISSAQHLKRRRYPVAFVRRGTCPTLIEEIRFGITNCFGIEQSELPEDKNELLKFASQKAGDLPFILIIDTAFERESRVSRDDGPLLGELAENSKKHNVFIAVALDDDITEADGVNSAIAQNYSIDYLDQEHLYRIVNTNIFPKYRQTQTLIRQIYSEFRQLLPSFRWSEQRFNSLYPLHPSILEVAPFIRLYAPDFALLSFASEAGAKILGRPANSLIALDEVFDNVENTLRKSEDLFEVFEAYDKINREVISKIPVMERLQAKLVLKSLLILSLDGDGTTAGEIAATMLIYDERDPQNSIKIVENMLESFTKAFPDEVWRKNFEGRETRFSFKLSKKDGLNSVLNEAIKTVSDDVLSNVFRRVAKDKFLDWHISVEGEETQTDWADSPVTWRGGVRRVRFFWDWNKENTDFKENKTKTDFIDLEIFIFAENELDPADLNGNSIPKAVWQTAKLRKDEIDTLKRLYILINDQNLREEYHEQVRAAGHTHLLAAEKIWSRIFLEDGRLQIGDKEYGFNQKTNGKLSLSEMFSGILAEYFENNYPGHPHFEKTLAMNDVSKLVNDLFSGARVNHENVQELAKTFALPLGLVDKQHEVYILESEDKLFNLPLSEKIISLVNQSSDGKVRLNTIYQALKESPFGLVREAQHLILAALVAQRKIEFITTKGDRINRRSLDLKILWDDIDGIAQPENILFQSEKLTKWAKILTNSPEIESIDNAEDRKKIKLALEKWLNKWTRTDLINRFNQLPDEILNTRIWYFSTNIEKTFGIVGHSIESIFDEHISLDEGLQRIADAFSDSEKEFMARKNDLAVLQNFIEGADLRNQIWSYLAVCESTLKPEIEDLREKLFEMIDQTSVSPNAEANDEMEKLWKDFHFRYSDNFAVKHDAIMKSHQLQEKFDETLKSDEWWEFENLSKLPIFQSHYWVETQKILKQFRELDCSFDVRENLKTHPFCACSFNLAKMHEWENLPKNLISTIKMGREGYRRTLILLGDILVQLLEPLADKENNQEFIKAFNELIVMFRENKDIPLFSINHLIILKNVLEDMTSSPLLEIKIPPETGLQSALELRAKLNSWLDELPKNPVLLKVH